MRKEMTPAEAKLWACLRDRQVGGAKFRRQQVIAGFIAAFYCHEYALAIEADGPTHEAQHDAERDAVLTAKVLSRCVSQMMKFCRILLLFRLVSSGFWMRPYFCQQAVRA